ncbi:MAG: 3D domain-containing protein [Deltaproteobacteria bacterium]|nr:3D domain-containing protein [Deltaproteobacteria bacterium]
MNGRSGMTSPPSRDGHLGDSLIKSGIPTDQDQSGSVGFTTGATTLWALPRIVRLVAVALALALLSSPASATRTAARQPAQKNQQNLGTFRLTYYHVAMEYAPRDGEQANWPIYEPSCENIITRTTRSFHDSLSLEGTGLLRDGRLVNFHERCSCARPGFQGSRICYEVLDRNDFPWGRGAIHKGEPLPLKPFLSVAVDPMMIPLGTTVYLPRLRGLHGPHGRKLNGCFRAEDTGRLIKGRKMDLFTGRPDWTRWMIRQYGIESISVIVNSPRCK